MLTATEIISKHIEFFFDIGTDEETCKICGKTKKCIKEKKVLSSNFTNFSDCIKKESKFICLDCANCLKNADLRKNNFIADINNLYLFKKNDIANYIFNLCDYITNDFVVGIARTFKKHNSFRCIVNTDLNKFIVQMEDRRFILDIKKAKKLFNILNEAYLFFTKDELLTGNYNSNSLFEYGLENYKKLESILKNERNTIFLEFLIYILNSEERNKKVKEIREEKKCKKKQKKKCQ